MNCKLNLNLRCPPPTAPHPSRPWEGKGERGMRVGGRGATLSGSLAIRNYDVSGFRLIFCQTWPQHPSRKTGLVLQCRLPVPGAPGARRGPQGAENWPKTGGRIYNLILPKVCPARCAVNLRSFGGGDKQGSEHLPPGSRSEPNIDVCVCGGGQSGPDRPPNPIKTL
jgi:hypothetical protein